MDGVRGSATVSMQLSYPAAAIDHGLRAAAVGAPVGGLAELDSREGHPHHPGPRKFVELSR